MKELVPERTGTLRKSLGIKVKKSEVRVGPRTGHERDGEDPTKIAHFAEYGTVHEQPRPFARPAQDEMIGAAIAAGAAVLNEALRREVEDEGGDE